MVSRATGKRVNSMPTGFVNWRLYADYSGGNLHEGLAQQLAFWYRLLDLKIPTEATTVGGAFRWSDRHEVPDTLSVSLLQPEGFLVTWDSSFSNAHPGLGEMLLGEEGTIARRAADPLRAGAREQPRGCSRRWAARRRCPGRTW